MKKPIWDLALVFENQASELSALLLELFNQIGLGPDEIEFADGPAKFDGFGWGDLTPGAHIRIHWTPQSILGDDWTPPENPDEEDPIDNPEFYEDGYVFTLPSMEGNDTAMAGIVHIPSPANWGGKGEIEPHWCTLNALVAMEGVDRIELLRTV